VGRRRQYECAYCGEVRPASDDHIPPRSIFAGVHGGRRISVKSCDDCNTGASADDEYFRDTVAKYYRVAETPKAKEVVESFLRATELPEKHRYTEAHVRALTGRDRVPPSSQEREALPEFVVDGERFDRAIRRYVRGLHRKVLGRRISPDTEISVASDPESLLPLQTKLIEIFRLGTRQVVVENVFWFTYVISEDCPTASTWLLVLFDEYPILAHVRDLSGLRLATG
jgi:hypothetical protein